VCTNSIPLKAEAAASGRIRVMSVAPLLARAIQSIHGETSISILFE
jgi:ribose-phosphate pyrophosphokinase